MKKKEHWSNRVLIDFYDFDITVRELLASVAIVAIMMVVGVPISEGIVDAQMEKNEKYYKAIQVESTDLFQHGMNTNVGNAFVYGDLIAVDTVTYPEIDGEYMYVEKVKERYTRHTRRRTYTDSNGKKHTKTETYWTWDVVDRESLKSTEVTFLGISFSSDKFNIPDTWYIETIKESSHVRYKYYGVETKHTGTIFTNLKDGTINDTHFYNGKNIEETIEYVESTGGEIFFWIFWIVLTGGLVFGFYYIDNEWLE